MVIVNFIDLFVTIFNLLLIVRVISSYIVRPSSRFYAGLVDLTEPVLGPVRKVLPKSPGIDWAPLVTFFLLEGIQTLVHSLLGIQ